MPFPTWCTSSTKRWRWSATSTKPPEHNFVRANGDDHRIFGAKPGAYGSGILALLDSKDWENDDDLATVYLAWSGYAYGRAGYGVPPRRRCGGASPSSTWR